MTTNTPLEPDPRTWLEPERVVNAKAELQNAQNLLKKAGLWEKALSYWIRQKITEEIENDEIFDQGEIEELTDKWFQSNENEKEKNKTERNMIRAQIKTKVACIAWSKKQWVHKIDSVYLQQKGRLDMASCRMIRISDKMMASELYYRIKAGEVQFESIAREFGEGEERHKGGLIPLQPLGNMPFGLAPILERLTPGDISTPLRIGKGFCIVELLKFQPSKLNKHTIEVLLTEQLKLWIKSVVELLSIDLESEVET